MIGNPYVTGSPEWHALRARHIGASEVAALWDAQPAYALSRYALWQVKAGRAEAPKVKGPRIDWGNRLEAVIAEAVAEERGWAITKGGYVQDAGCPQLGASLDYTIAASPELEAAGFVGPGVLENKAVDWLVHKRTWTDAEPPPHILLQLQTQLAASGCSWGAVAALVSGNDLRVYQYHARPKLIADIRRRVTEFWTSIEEGREPPVDGSSGASAVLRALYPELDDQPADMTADNALPAICADFLNAVERRKAAEAEEALLKNQLVAKIGPHRSVLTEGFRISVSVTPARPERAAEPGEIIAGRKETRRYSVKEYITQ